ncbi:MAG: redoxin domain-containing protein [Pirellulaceae bacterium]|nr:redoxin domain-containing protein [Pirellulaceae bacterium]
MNRFPPCVLQIALFWKSRSYSYFVAVCIGLLSFSQLGVAASPSLKLLGSLPDADGKLMQVRSVSEHRLQVFCFLGCDCPLAKLYGPRLQQLSDEFSNQDVQFIGINSNLQDSLADIKTYVQQLELTFSVLKDHDQIVLAALEGKRTPEVIVLDSSGKEVYRGRIDDQYAPGQMRSKPTRDDLRSAIKEHLEGKPVRVPRTEAVGCLIARRRQASSDSTVTYCKQITRLLDHHCIECHQPNEIAPFSLLDYSEVVGWSDMMLETIEQHRMPPWHADPAHGDFINARNMSGDDRELFRQWVLDGTPYGDPLDRPKVDLSKDHQQPKQRADIEIPMQAEPYEVAAEGALDYQYFVVDPKFEEDRWVRMAELTPSNRSVVHHGIVFVRPPDGIHVEGIGWLTAYVPGQVSPESPSYRARRVPAGSKLVFQMHYTPNGKPAQDLSVLRLAFADSAEVTEEHISILSINQELEIPAGAADVKINGRSPRLPSDGLLLAMSPHMHLRGKAMRVESKSGEDRKILLDVPHYDFNWQHTYILRQPIPLKSIDALTFVATFDNSKENPSNPDPAAFVTWGDQTWEEMAIVFYEVVKPIVKDSKNTAQSKKPESTETAALRITDHHRSLSDQLFNDLDRDKSGKIAYEEVDQAVQLRNFKLFDLNHDRVITRDEASEAISRMNR